MTRGRFITFEGIDGSGKSTQLRLLSQWLNGQGKETVDTVEPGGTAIGRRIRAILLDPASAGIASQTELLLYFASRAQNVEEVIRPALESGRIVLCDRFTDSTVVYQGCGRGLDSSVILDLDRIACRGLRPDITILMDIDVATSMARASRRNDVAGPAESRIDMESPAFHQRVRNGYLALAGSEPGRFIIVDGRAPVVEVARIIQETLSGRV